MPPLSDLSNVIADETTTVRRGRAGRGRSGLRWQAIALLALLALAARIVHVRSAAAAPTARHLIGDSAGYDEWSSRIAAGEWLGTRAFYQAPLYPYLLAVWKTLAASHSTRSILYWQACWGAIACALLALATARAFDSRAGVVAGLMLALYGPAVYFDGIVQKAALDGLLVCAVLAVMSLADRRLWVFGLLGAVVSLLSLTRENAMAWHLILPLWILFSAMNMKDPAHAAAPGRLRAKGLGAYLLGAAVVLAPVGLRNAYVGGEFSPTTFQAGPNFYIGNHRGADGRYQPLVRGHETPQFEQRDAAELAQRDEGRPLSPREVSRHWLRRAASEIKADPAAWLQLLGYKLLLTWNRYEIADAESIVIYRRHSPLLDALARVWHFGVLAPLAIFGAVANWSRRRPLWVLYALILTITLAVAAFYVLARYRYPLVPLLIPFAAAGVVHAWERRGMGRKLLTPFLCAIAVGVIVNWPIQDERRLDALAEMNAGVALAQAGEIEEASAYFARAVAGHPQSAEANYNLGQALALRGDFARAIAAYHNVLRLDPELSGVHFNLAVALEQTGDRKSARRHYELALRQDPADSDARAALQRLKASD